MPHLPQDRDYKNSPKRLCVGGICAIIALILAFIAIMLPPTIPSDQSTADRLYREAHRRAIDQNTAAAKAYAIKELKRGVR